MATVRVYNYEYGNYNETITPNTTDLNVLFQAPLMSFDNINISYNDGLMLSLTLNITDDLIEQINYLTLNEGLYDDGKKLNSWQFVRQADTGQGLEEITFPYDDPINSVQAADYINYAVLVGNRPIGTEIQLYNEYDGEWFIFKVVENDRKAMWEFLGNDDDYTPPVDVIRLQISGVDDDISPLNIFGAMEHINETYPPSDYEDGKVYYVENIDGSMWFVRNIHETVEIKFASIKPYFVLSYQYIMKDQYTISCKLDSVLYKLSDIKGAEGLVERGFIDESNKLIYNNEGIQVTQLKRSEHKLAEKFGSGSTGVYADVGYYAVYMDNKIGSTRNSTGTSPNIEYTDELELELEGSSEEVYGSYATLEDVPIYQYENNATYFGSASKPDIYIRTTRGDRGTYISLFSLGEEVFGMKYYEQLQKLRYDNNYTKLEVVESYKIYTLDDNYKNSNLKLGKVSSSNIGGLTYKINLNGTNVDTPYQMFSDFRRETYWFPPFIWAFLWGGNAPSGGLGFICDKLNVDLINVSSMTIPFSPFSIQHNSTTIYGTKYSKSQLLAWNDRVIAIGAPGQQIYKKIKAVEEPMETRTVLANSPAKMLEYAATKTTPNISQWAPQLDTNSINVLTSKTNYNNETLSSSSWSWVTQTVKNEIADTTKDYNYEVLTYDISTTKITVRFEDYYVGPKKTLKTFGGASPNLLLQPNVNNLPFKLLLFPFGNLALSRAISSGYTGSNTLVQGEDRVLNVVNNLIAKYGGGSSPRIYDVQRVPYGSVNLSKYISEWSSIYDMIRINGNNSATDEVLDECYLIKDENYVPQLCMFVPHNTSRVMNLYTDASIYKQALKVDAITNKAIIQSQGYKSLYEYDYVKNDYGSDFVATIDLKPITPYFNIDPVGSPIGLMQDNYTDGRGINIAEDMSTTQVTDAFNAYKRENFNYLNSFNSQQDYERDRLSKEQSNQQAQQSLQQKQSWENYGVNSATGIAKGAAMGAVGGAMLGPIGAAAGAGMGALKGVMDAGINAIGTAVQNKQQKENLALTQAQGRDMLGLQQAQAKQQFNYSIQNIQALPNKLDKVSGTTSLSKRTARISLYDTTSEERARVENYLELNGYTINTYDTLGKYIDFDKDITYVKGNIIKFNKAINNIILQDINTRLMVGVRFKKFETGEE